MLALDGRNGLRAARRIAEGGLHGCSVDPRDVLRSVIREAASAFVLVHNHPSGDPAPSDEDIELTRMVARAGAVLGTPLVDTRSSEATATLRSSIGNRAPTLVVLGEGSPWAGQCPREKASAAGGTGAVARRQQDLSGRHGGGAKLQPRRRGPGVRRPGRARRAAARARRCAWSRGWRRSRAGRSASAIAS